MKTINPGHSTVHPNHSVRLFYVFLLFRSITVPGLQTATKTWDGSRDNLWSTVENWSGNIPLLDGDDVVFPAGAANKNNSNDKLNLCLRSIQFTDSGYQLSGNSVTITNGVWPEQGSWGGTSSTSIFTSAAQSLSRVTTTAPLWH